MTNTTKANAAAVLKTDVLGRVLTPASRRATLLGEFERSGMSGPKFAAFVGIKYQTFATWVQQRRRARATPATPANTAQQLRWMEAVLEPTQPPADPNSTPLVLHLPGGARVEITEMKQVALVAALLRTLTPPPLPC